MSQQENDDDRSFEATPQKLEQAREKGDVVKSMDLVTCAAFMAVFVAVWAAGPWMLSGFGTVLSSIWDLSFEFAPAFFGGTSSSISADVISLTAIHIAPIFVLPMIFALVILLAQRAIVFVPSKVSPKLSRISPVENAKNKYGWSGLFEFLKSAAKLAVYSIILALFIYFRLPDLLILPQTDVYSVARLMVELGLDFLALIIIVSLLSGVLDWLWQRAQHLRKNRMTRREVQDETKDSEGDPYQKSRRKKRAQSVASNKMMQDVSSSDVVIVNPTHYAIALRWDRDASAAPVCVARGVDHVALAIRRRAAEQGVPIYDDPPTARALHACLDIGAEVPETYYRPVAAAIRFADDLKQRATTAAS